MALPNFLLLGAAKTGTTSLYQYLKQHPQIYMSPSKEPRFFAFEGETLDFRGIGDSKETAITDIQIYLTLFEKVTNETAIGEASTMYLWSPKAPERIHHYIPDARLIAILRDPIERAYSNFLHLIQAGREPLNDFAQAIQAEESRIRDHWWPFWYYKEQGFYYLQLKRYFDRFDQDQIKICLYEDFRDTPIALFRDICRFLGVDDNFIPDVSEKIRVSRPVPKNKLLHTLLTQPNTIKSALKLLLPPGICQRISTNVQNRNLIKQKPSIEIRKQLIKVYQEDIFQLQDLIQRDLSQWLKM
jgi:Sulfotransferase family